MIPTDYQSVIIRLARMGRNDAVAVVESAMAAGVPALTVLLEACDYMLARLRPIPPHVAAPRGESVPYQPAMPAQPAQAAKPPAQAQPVAVTDHEPRATNHEPAKHSPDDAHKRAALRARMATATPELAQPEPTPEPEPDKPVLQLPTFTAPDLLRDSTAALMALGYSKQESRRMAITCLEYGAKDVEAVIRACTAKRAR